ncbi:hypothetical protein EYR38_004674 [Pleurotus pulmonarius]|nr:hypothetical protein EYR38_004674 [Pleurotus pulmonarius]
MYTSITPLLYWTTLSVYRLTPSISKKATIVDFLDSIVMSSTTTTFLLLALVFLISVYLRRRTVRRPPLPPGPPAEPLIGHLRIMPSDQEELVFHEWAKTYGDVMHLRVLGRDLIILDSVQAATEILEKRSALYSDRPNFTIYTSLMGWDLNMAFFPYGRRFRKHRKLLQSYLTQQSIVKFRPTQLINARYLAKGLIENKRDFGHSISRYATSVVMRIAYGHQIMSEDDEFMTIVNDVAYALNNGGPPGATIVDYFPILQYFPSWFPGTSYAAFARQWKWAIDKLFNVPYEQAEGTAEPSFLRSQMEAVSDKDLTDEDIQDLKGSAGVLFAGGADTEILRGINLDKSVYTEPTKFNPDRFLPKSQGGNEEPRPIATFGFGRRICPGRHLAAASIWIAVATMFATVNVNKAKDEDGNEITPEIMFETGLTSRPKAFSCSIMPRSEKAIGVVASECETSSREEYLLRTAAHKHFVIQAGDRPAYGVPVRVDEELMLQVHFAAWDIQDAHLPV